MSKYTPTEQEVEMADEELDRIVRFKRDLLGDIAFHQRWHKDIDLTEMMALVEEAFDEAHYKAWHKNTDISCSVDWPIEIPPYKLCSFITPKERADREWAAKNRIALTNPNSYLAKGEAL